MNDGNVIDQFMWQWQQHFRIAVRQGFETEFVPQVFDQATMRPTFQSGWLAYARVGTGLVVPEAFQLIANS